MTIELKIGQVRHPKNVPDVLAKTDGGSESESYNPTTKEFTPIYLYLLTNDFPSAHFFVIADMPQNYLFPENNFCVVHIITNNGANNNIPITPDLFNAAVSKKDFTKYFISRDTFLIAREHIAMKRIYGEFYIDKLKAAVEY